MSKDPEAATTPEPAPVPLETASGPSKLSLETALERLDSIVREMEAGELPLDTLITRYEEGAALAAQCRKQLDAAEERIRILTRDAQGNPVLEDFEPNNAE